MVDLENILVLLGVLFLIWMLIKNVKEIKVHSEKSQFIGGFILFFPCFLFLLPLVIVLSGICWFYRHILSFILKVNLGNEYYGLVKDFDVFHVLEKPEFSIIHILTILECDEHIGGGLYEWFKSCIHKYQMDCESIVTKLYCAVENWMGYSYYKKITATTDDYVLKLPVNSKLTELENADLIKLLSKSYYNPMPCNNRMLWDIQIGTQPLKCDNANKKKYPVLFRVHHGVGDGITLVKLLLNMFSEDNRHHFEVTSNISKYLEQQENWYSQLIQLIWTSLEMCILFPSLIYTMFVLKRHDKTTLHGNECIKKEFLSCGTDKDGKYFQKVKTIKSKCFQMSFSEILITAITASLRDCCEKHTTNAPMYITGLLPIISNYEDLLHTNYKKVALINRYISLHLKLPISIENREDYIKEYPLISRLKIINKLLKSSRSPTEVLFKKSVFPTLGGLLPPCVLRFLITQLSFIVAISILPGPSQFIINKGAIELSNCVFWNPHTLKLAMNFSLITYKNQLELCLNCNGALGLDEDAVSDIIKNTYKYLDLLDKEIEECRVQENNLL